MPIKRIQQTVPLRILDWQRCVGLFLEGFSLLCELHGAQVPEGRVEPLVVVPPHVPVDVRAQLLHVRVDVPVDELLPDEPVGGFDHRAVVRVARPGKGTRDAEHVEHAFDAFPGEPAAAIRVGNTSISSSGKRSAANAANTRSASCPTPTEWPAICRLARSPGRQTYAHELPTLT